MPAVTRRGPIRGGPFLPAPQPRQTDSPSPLDPISGVAAGSTQGVAPTVAQTVVQTTTIQSLTLLAKSGITTTAGNRLLIHIGTRLAASAQTVASVVDTPGNTWTKLANKAGTGAPFPNAEVWTTTQDVGFINNGTITVNLTGAADAVEWRMFELANAGALDVSVTAAGTIQQMWPNSTATGALAAIDELIMGLIVFSQSTTASKQTFTQGVGEITYEDRSNVISFNSLIDSSYLTAQQTAGQAFSAVLGQNAPWCAICYVIKSSASGPLGAATVLREMDAASAAATGETADITILRELDGAIAATTTEAGAITILRELDAALAAVTGETAAITILRELDAALAATTGETAALIILRELDAALAASTSSAAAITIARELDAALAAGTTEAGAITALREMDGASAATTGATASLVNLLVISAGSLTAATTASGAMVILRGLAGSMTGIASLVADLLLIHYMYEDLILLPASNLSLEVHGPDSAVGLTGSDPATLDGEL
jgi:hypothetical protein